MESIKEVRSILASVKREEEKHARVLYSSVRMPCAQLCQTLLHSHSLAQFVATAAVAHNRKAAQPAHGDSEQAVIGFATADAAKQGRQGHRLRYAAYLTGQPSPRGRPG